MDSSTRTRSHSRRAFLSHVGRGVCVGALAGAAGCLSTFGSDPVTVGYRPAFHTLQAPLVVKRGYLDELDASVEAKNYRTADGDLTGDYRNGTTEVAFVDVHWAIFERGHGTDATITAANNVDGFTLWARPEFADLWRDHGPDAFARFQERTGEPFALASRPNLDTVVAKRWLDALGVSSERVELVDAAIDRTLKRSRIEEGEIDGEIVSPPIPTLQPPSKLGLERIARVGDNLDRQPGGVLVMREGVRKDDPGVARRILKQHLRATELLMARPDDAAKEVSTALGDSVSTELATRVLQKKTANFVTDPQNITSEADSFSKIMTESGVLDGSINVGSLVDTSLYTEVA
jgi:NitT/TauT family transport system substrate-binding protein